MRNTYFLQENLQGRKMSGGADNFGKRNRSGGSSGYISPTRSSAAYIMAKTVPSAGPFPNAQDLSAATPVAKVSTGGILADPLLGDSNSLKVLSTTTNGDYLTFDSTSGGYQFSTGTSGTIAGPIVTTGVATNVPGRIDLSQAAGVGNNTAYLAGPLIATNNATGNSETLSIPNPVATVGQVLSCTASQTVGSAATYGYTTPVSTAVGVMTVQAEGTLSNEYNMAFKLTSTGLSGGNPQSGIVQGSTSGTSAAFSDIVPGAAGAGSVLTCTSYTSAASNVEAFSAPPTATGQFLQCNTFASGSPQTAGLTFVYPALQNGDVAVLASTTKAANSGMSAPVYLGALATGVMLTTPSAGVAAISSLVGAANQVLQSASATTYAFQGPFFAWGQQLADTQSSILVSVTGMTANSLVFTEWLINLNATPTIIKTVVPGTGAFEVTFNQTTTSTDTFVWFAVMLKTTVL
jgi:hypothetical protein